jgi:predicted ATPase
MNALSHTTAWLAPRCQRPPQHRAPRARASGSCQSAKALELRAAIRLARLSQEQDRHSDARDLLAPIYGWFTEGFDTPVLQEAKILLDALKSRGAH